MSISQTQHNIKHRSVANDVFITPRPLAREHIEIVQNIIETTEICDNLYYIDYLDPCRNNENGSYYSQLKEFVEEEHLDWCEISEGRDFFKYRKSFDNIDPAVIIGNLPFSMIDKWLEETIKFDASVISYLMPVYSLTAKRLEMMEKAGYYLVNMHQFKWYVCNGMCCFATWIACNSSNCGEQPSGIKPFTFNRQVWYNVEKWEEKKKRELVRKQKKEEKEKKKWKKIYSKILKRDLIVAVFIRWGW